MARVDRAASSRDRSTDARPLPSSRCRATVSTAGSSGTQLRPVTRLDLGQLRAHASRSRGRRARSASLRGGVVAELVGGEHVGRGLCRRSPRRGRGSRRERLARLDGVAALLEADDADRVVDRVRPSSAGRRRGGARRSPTRDRAERVHRARARGACTWRTTGALRQRAEVGVAALRADPALVRRERRAVGDGRLGAAPSLRLVDAEVGEREQVRARVEHELGEVGRALAADRVGAPRGSRARSRPRARAAGPCR